MITNFLKICKCTFSGRFFNKRLEDDELFYMAAKGILPPSAKQ
jgi:hypothetical protein